MLSSKLARAMKRTLSASHGKKTVNEVTGSTRLTAIKGAFLAPFLPSIEQEFGTFDESMDAQERRDLLV